MQKSMKIKIPFLFLLLTVSAFGQKASETLATATGHTFTVSNLSAEAQDAYAKLPAVIADARKQLLAQMVGALWTKSSCSPNCWYTAVSNSVALSGSAGGCWRR